MSKISTHILSIISSYTTNEITESQFNDLQEWLNESPENKQTFSSYLHLYKKSRKISFIENLDKDKAWSNILLSLEKPLGKENKKLTSQVIRLRSISRFFKYAAMGIILLGLGYLINDKFISNNPEPTPVIVNTNIIEPGTDKATLTLEDGSQVVLEKGESFKNQNVNSNGEEIEYETGNQKSAETAYNYLTIPRGGQFFIKLSDGTQVWLNSESQLKYPVNFKEGAIREVELVYGEAYFDVSPSTEHNGSKFKVLNQSQEIEVIGTQFNIKAYENDSNIYTTLVEGKVSVSSENLTQILKPKQQSNLNLSNNNISVSTVDVYDEISWKDGVFSFSRKPLDEIMKVLSRWYDIDVEYANPDLKKEGFNGVLRKNQKIEDILKTIKSFGVIEDYEIKNKKVILR